MEVRTIKIKYLKEGLEKINHIDNGDWIDLRTAEDIHLEPNEFKLIPLGVAMALPQNYEALLIPHLRSTASYRLIQLVSLMNHIVETTMNGNFQHMQQWKLTYLRTLEYANSES